MAQLDQVGHSLLTAAGDLLANEGPGALTVRRIASEAGMSTMNVYSRFGNKDGVVDQLFIEGFELLAAALRTAPATDDPMADLDGCRNAYRQFALDNTTLYSVMFERVVPDYEPSPAAITIATATLDVLASRLERAMDSGAIRRADPLTCAAVVWSTCHGALSLEMKHKGPDAIDWAAVYTMATTAVLAGLAAPAPGPE